MLSTMSFCPAVESAACSMSSDFLGGVVNTQGFVWKFVCVIYNFYSFIHSSAGRNHVVSTSQNLTACSISARESRVESTSRTL